MKFLPLVKKSIYFSIFICAFILTIISCENDPIQPQDNTNIIAGTITDGADMSVPYAVVLVTTNDKVKLGTKITEEKIIAADTTDEDGNFSLTTLPIDLSNYNFKVIHPDFQLYQTNLQDMIANKDRKKVPVKLLNDTNCKGRIEVFVKAKKDSSVLTEVEVRLNRSGTVIRKTNVNAEGKVVFENVCNGSYWLRIAKTNYKVIETDGLTIEGGNTIVRTMYMEPVPPPDTCCNGVIKFIVKDAGTQDGLNGVIVKISKGGKLLGSQTTENFTTSFTKICPGTYSFSIWKQGYYLQEFSYEVGCNDTIQMSRDLVQDSCCNGKILISVKDTNGVILPLTELNLFKNGVKLGSVKTDQNGNYLFTGMCQGDYGFTIRREGFTPYEFPVIITCNDSVYLEKFMKPIVKDTCCNGVIKIFVLDANNKEPRNGATVKMWFGGAYVTSAVVANGFVTFSGLCTGKYSFDITNPNYTHQEFNVELPCNGSVQLEKLLVPETPKDTCCKGKVKIALKNANNELMNGAVVKIYKNGTLLGSQTVANGYVLFQELCAGKYSFSVSKDGYKPVEYSREMICNQIFELNEMLTLASTPDSCCNGSLKIIVRDSKTKESLNGATVKLWLGGKLLNTATVSGGYVIFKPLCKGTYGFNILKEKYKGIEFNAELGCDENKVVEKTLDPEISDSCCNGIYNLTFADSATSEPVKEATVNLWKGSTKLTTLYTNAEGKVSFTKLCEGEYSISSSRTGYKGREWTFSIGCNETLNVETKKLAKLPADTCCTAILKVRVIDDSTGAYISNARVVIYKGDNAIADPRTGVEGWAVVEKLCGKTTYTVVVSIDGYVTSTTTVTYGECVTQAISVRLKK